MHFDELERETIVGLPERLETSDYNWSSVAFSQTNVGLQAAFLSGQSMLQVNGATVHVTQFA